MLEPIEFKDFYLASNADVEDPGWTASQSCVGQQLLFLRIYLQRTLTSFLKNMTKILKIQFDDLVQYFFSTRSTRIS